MGLQLLGPPLTDLLHPRRPVEAGIRCQAVLAACKVLQHAAPSPDL